MPVKPISNQTGISSTRRLAAIFGGSMGNLVEWYDWYAYSAFAIYFSQSFFPKSDNTAQLMNTAGIFAIGFLMRPIGGWLFGSLADKAGRKKAMLLSVLLMSLGSLVIAVTPTYKTIGAGAWVLLLAARLLQGLSLGGEYGVSATYLSEMATSKSRGFYSSFQYVTLIGGQLIALGIQIILQKLLLTEQELQSWGWRIPFFIGAILALITLYLRRRMDETTDFKTVEKKAGKGTIKTLLKHPKAVLTVIGLSLGGTLAFYTYTTYMQKFLINTVHLSKEQSTNLSFFSLLLFAMLQPLFGALSDRIGRRPVLIAFGILGTICTVPLLTTLSHTTGQWQAFGLLVAALIIVSGYTSINAVVKAELFPAEIRALGVGLPYALTVAIFGGTAEYIALAFKDAKHEDYFYWYITGCIGISLLVYVFMPDTKKVSKMDGVEQATGIEVTNFEFLITGDIEIPEEKFDEIMTPNAFAWTKALENNCYYYYVDEGHFSYSFEPPGIQMIFNKEMSYTKALKIAAEIVYNINNTGQKAELVLLDSTKVYKFS